MENVTLSITVDEETYKALLTQVRMAHRDVDASAVTAEEILPLALDCLLRRKSGTTKGVQP
jgi:hypothetical protein